MTFFCSLPQLLDFDLQSIWPAQFWQFTLLDVCSWLVVKVLTESDCVQEGFLMNGQQDMILCQYIIPLLWLTDLYSSLLTDWASMFQTYKICFVMLPVKEIECSGMRMCCSGDLLRDWLVPEVRTGGDEYVVLATFWCIFIFVTKGYSIAALVDVWYWKLFGNQVYLTAFWTFVLLQVKVKVHFHCVKSRPDASWMQWSLNLSVVGHMTWACPGQLLCVQCFLLTNQSSDFPTMFNSVQPHLEYCVELWAPQY